MLRRAVKASVVIPTLNCWDLLEMTLYGLSRQSCSPHCFEVIISDDGSEDGLAESLACLDLPFDVRVVREQRHSAHIRLASVRNRGILAAANDIIIILDADCVPTPWFIESHLDHFISSRISLVVVGIRKFVAAKNVKTLVEPSRGGWIISDPEIPSVSNFGWLRDRRLPELARLAYHPMPFNCFHTCNASFRRHDAIRAGLFDEEFDGRWGYEDIELGYRLWNLGACFRYEPRAVVFHQENELHTLDQRLAGRTTNFQLACVKIPHFREFRAMLGR